MYVLTDAFFDDEDECGRVMSMLDEKSEPETVERFVTLDLAFKDRDEAFRSRDEAFRSRDEAFRSRDDALNKVKIANARISELEKENNELKNQLKNVK